MQASDPNDLPQTVVPVHDTECPVIDVTPRVVEGVSMRLILGTATVFLTLSTGYVVGQGKETSAKERSRGQAAQVSEQDRQFWAFTPLRKVTPPKPRDTGWAKNPIDLFIRAAQEQHGLDPSPTASPRTLYRRASFALRGLPPAPDAADKFKPSAWADTIDGFLATPQFGERWARRQFEF